MDLYIPSHSFVHRLHPGAKILGLVLLSASPLILIRPLPLLAPLAVAGLLAVLTGAIANLRRTAPFLTLFFVLTVCLWAVFQREGPPLGPYVPVSVAGLEHGLAMGIRLVALTVGGLVFLTATSVEEFSQGLRSLGMGYRASFALSLSFRLVPLIFSTIETVVLAQKSRGFDLSRRSLFARLRGYIPLFVPIVSLALRDADGLALAIECRGFGAGPRTAFGERPWNSVDVAALLLPIALLAVCVVWRWRFIL